MTDPHVFQDRREIYGDYENGPSPNGHDGYESMPFLGYSGPMVDPRKETIFDMFKFSCCPALRLFSFITLISFLDVVIYIITLTWNGIETPSMEFLKPLSATLNEFGNRNPYLMRYDYQVWRFLTPVFLHANFLHIAFNLLIQVIFGSLAEAQLGTIKVIVIYFSCAIGGNLFGALVSDSVAVGASTAIVGLLGVFLALIIVNWNRMDPNLKCFLAFLTGFIIFFNLVYSFAGSRQTLGKGPDQVDNFGHFGGLVAGIFSGMALIRPAGEIIRNYEKNVRRVGIALWAAYFIVGFALFYTISKPVKPY